jgi:hypothetical protein
MVSNLLREPQNDILDRRKPHRLSHRSSKIRKLGGTIRISSFNYDHAWRQGLRSTDGNIRMVRGIDRFREHFRGYESSYALIGSWRTHKIFSCGLPSVTIHPRHRHEQTRSISDKKSLIPQSNNKISEQKIVRRNEINFKYNQ